MKGRGMKAFLTGASSGIGEAMAHLLASKGYELILSGRNAKALQQIAESLKAEYIVADLGRKEDRLTLINSIKKELPDLVINCAGYANYGEMLTQPLRDHITCIEVNAIAPIELTLEAAYALVSAKKKGTILNVSSAAGEQPAPGMGLYGSAKACLTHFSQTLNTELAGKGVHVLVSCPGMVTSPFASRAARKKAVFRGSKMSPEYAAKQLWKQIERGKEKQIFNWVYQIGIFLTPSFIAKRMIWRRIQKRL